jgi:hypothetical protein
MGEARYEAITSHDPHYHFMVWDWQENKSLAYSMTKEEAELVALALNNYNH